MWVYVQYGKNYSANVQTGAMEWRLGGWGCQSTPFTRDHFYIVDNIVETALNTTMNKQTKKRLHQNHTQQFTVSGTMLDIVINS